MDIAARGPSAPKNLDLTLLLSVLTAVKKGDFSARMPLDWNGIDGKIADTLNAIIELNDKTARGLDRVSNAVGQEGKLGERMKKVHDTFKYARPPCGHLACWLSQSKVNCVLSKPPSRACQEGLMRVGPNRSTPWSSWL